MSCVVNLNLCLRVTIVQMYITEYIADCLIPVKQMDWVKVDNSIVSHLQHSQNNKECQNNFLQWLFSQKLL